MAHPPPPADAALLLSRAARYAAQAERCTSQLQRKLAQWGAAPELAQGIVARLEAERLVDDARFATVYARSKQRAGWGPLKVRAGLRALGLPAALVARALQQAAPEAAEAAGAADASGPPPLLLKALRQKLATLKPQPPQQRSARLYRFALQRGFAPAQIRAALGALGAEADTRSEAGE